MDIREIVRHMRQGQSNRAIEEATGSDRRTVGRYRKWAEEQGLLEGPLPGLGELRRDGFPVHQRGFGQVDLPLVHQASFLST